MKHPSTPSLSMQLECLFKRFPIVCHICSERIDWDADRDWDHVVEHQESRVHTAEALAPVHRTPCHRIKSGKKLSERRHIDRLEKVKSRAAITSNPEIMGGKWCIAGTRIPAIAIKHFHKDGYTVGAIIDQYPSLTREQVQAAIDFKIKRERKIKSAGFPKVARPFQRKAG